MQKILITSYFLLPKNPVGFFVEVRVNSEEVRSKNPAHLRERVFGMFELNDTNLMCLKSQDFLLFESILTQRTVTLCSLCPLIFYQVF